MKVGRSTTYRIWVEGTRERVELRVHNAAPDIVRLNGGDNQFLHTSGGRHNQAKVKLKSLRPGSAKIDVHPYSRDAKQEASLIAAEIAPRLAALQAKFLRERAALRGPPYPAKALTALLDRTETALKEILGYDELAAMRDHVRVVIREARAGHGVALAAHRFTQRGASPEESPWDRIERLIARLLELSSKNDLVVDLCVTSKPRFGARFAMEPESYADGGKDALTTGEIVNAYRGRYVFRASLDSWKPIECRPRPGNAHRDSCRPIDLVDDSRPLLVCDFDARLCHRSGEALPEECRDSG